MRKRPRHIFATWVKEEMEAVLRFVSIGTLILKFAIGPLDTWGRAVGSNSRSPKARHRFGFSGPPNKEKKDRITTDDILDSLTRQAELKQKLGKEDRVALDEISETEDLIRFQGLNPEPVSPSMIEKKTGYGHLVFVFMLLTGLTVVWLYSSISKPFDLALLNGVLQKSGVQSIFADMSQLGVIALAALVGALWIRRKRQGSSLQLRSL